MKNPTWKSLSLTISILLLGETVALAQAPLRTQPWRQSTVPMRAVESGENSNAATQPIFSNFVTDSCTGCLYSLDNGLLVLGPTNCFTPGTPQWLAYPFVARHSGVARKVTVAVTLTPGSCGAVTTQFTVAIYSDKCEGVDAPLAQAVARVADAPCDTVSVTLHHGPSLVQGTKYWVVCTADNDFVATWWQPNESIYSVNLGSGWLLETEGSTGAFSVQ